ncbi:YbfB/YjiJ family MFS transporter [Pseudochrobactrum asaccharolyticum]|uniref:Putative MFS-type transporter YbfB n=1 Tax=Pseudochrobactrum asaccharolyticum TaxID=354351 RepID=A0A366DLH3_9HYPH|nr:YbfB/YjiJ family MFS transporter [Pseudochrobactrum asaccharolyticum]RBO90937.1 putative MFS-type transporter YbfB [Pseudochrobactrum asaccharolyticum]
MNDRHEMTATFGAALVLVVGMGFGRFAFTGLYPLMVADHQISVEGGSYAASANYAGYLIGALLAALLSGIPSHRLCSIATFMTVITLGVLAAPMPEWLIVSVRGLAGLFSAISMVAASHWLINDRRHYAGAPALYAGVGLGIFLSAELIAVGYNAELTSYQVWLALAVAALVFTISAIVIQARTGRFVPRQQASHRGLAEAPQVLLGATRLNIIYGLAGLGYIVTATYLPLLVGSALASLNPVHIWAIFGLGAAPSCFLWHFLHAKWGLHRSLKINLWIQAIGVALPIIHTPASYITSALLVGGTFMGTVTIAMPAARQLSAKVRFNMLAVMTASYGVGQIVGPLIASALYARTASFDASLLIAALALLGAGALCFKPSTH